MKPQFVSVLASTILFAIAAGPVSANDLASLEQAARSEGQINSIGMPDNWANWKSTWTDICSKYGLQHNDTDMSSAQEIARFAAEKNNASADIGDVGAAFGPIAVQHGVTQPYKPTTWDQIPDWAKDKEGHWALAYTGTIAFIVNKQLVSDVPHSWADLKKGKYSVNIGNVSTAAQASNGVLAANYALGGDEKDLTPALSFFGELAKEGRLGITEPSIANLEKGEIQVAIVWDFNGLYDRDKIDKNQFEVLIPEDGSVTSGYTTIINKYARHASAAKLTREYIFSDAGQTHLAEGYARPIRSAYLTLPASIKNKLLPEAQYAHAHPITDFAAWEKSAKALPHLWQEKVIINMQQ